MDIEPTESTGPIYVYYDFETTGLGHSRWSDNAGRYVLVKPPQAVELAAKCGRDEFHSLVKPTCILEARSSYVHGIYRLNSRIVARVVPNDSGTMLNEQERIHVLATLRSARDSINSDTKKAIDTGKTYRPDPYNPSLENHIEQGGSLSYVENTTSGPFTVYQSFIEWLNVLKAGAKDRSLCLVAYNGHAFDQPIMEESLRFHGLVLPAGTTFDDPYPLAKQTLKIDRFRLCDVHAHLVGHEMIDAHEAMGDVRALEAVHQVLLTRRKNQLLAVVQDAQMRIAEAQARGASTDNHKTDILVKDESPELSASSSVCGVKRVREASEERQGEECEAGCE